MNSLILMMSICCFLGCSFFLFSRLTGNVIFKILARAVGILGTFSPLIYWFKLGGII